MNAQVSKQQVPKQHVPLAVKIAAHLYLLAGVLFTANRLLSSRDFTVKLISELFGVYLTFLVWQGLLSLDRFAWKFVVLFENIIFLLALCAVIYFKPRALGPPPARVIVAFLIGIGINVLLLLRSSRQAFKR